MKQFLSILFLLLTTSCTFVAEVPQGEQLALKVSVLDISLDKDTFGTEWIYGNQHLIDIGKYDNIDSVIFEAGVRSQFEDPQCEVELYDHSADKSVIGSRIRSNVHFQIHTIHSSNIDRTFPKSGSLISFRFRSTGDNNYSRVTSARVLVYYK